MNQHNKEKEKRDWTYICKDVLITFIIINNLALLSGFFVELVMAQHDLIVLSLLIAGAMFSTSILSFILYIILQFKAKKEHVEIARPKEIKNFISKRKKK